MAEAFDLIRLPQPKRAPGAAVARRVGLALGLVCFITAVVWLGRDGYVDVTGDRLSLLDALYYSSVTVTTTGYGDITAVTPGARLATIVLITPARIVFLILVVGTTVEVLTEQSRQLAAARRWRKTLQDHHVICGFGQTGQAVALDLLARGVSLDKIVAIDTDTAALEECERMGIVGIRGDATRNAVLEQAGVGTAKAVIITPNRDDTAVLITLSVREIHPAVRLVAGAREQENIHFLEQGGADEVIDATATVGRFLGLGTQTDGAVDVVNDLLDAAGGLVLVEIEPVQGADGRWWAPDGCEVVAAMRDGKRLPSSALQSGEILETDRLVVLQGS